MKEQNHLRETENKMFIDLHLHESAYSPDSQMTLDELVQAAREKTLISAAELGYLEQYESPEAEAIDAGYRDKDGYWTGLALVPAGFLVNNDVLKEKGLEVPKTWEDLADPKYKDEIIMASPAISGTQYAILNGTLQAWGEEKGWEIWTAINDNVDFFPILFREGTEKVDSTAYV